MRLRKIIASGMAVLVLGVGLAACGDDEDEGVATDTTDESSGDGDVVTYCDKTLEIETLGEPDVDWETASEEEMAEASKSFAAEKMQPLAAQIKAAAPSEVAPHIEVLAAAVDEVAETGDFEAAFDDETEEASEAAHSFDLDNCDWNVVDVTAKEYEFSGVDAELEAGPTSFEFSNEGKELHEFAIVRKNADTSESFDELLELPQEQAETKTTFINAAFGAPGEEGVYAVADLTPGEYLAVCFIPVGSVDEETEADGPPHFTQGMKHEFTVS